jgi:hypothetical protein
MAFSPMPRRMAISLAVFPGHRLPEQVVVFGNNYFRKLCHKGVWRKRPVGYVHVLAPFKLFFKKTKSRVNPAFCVICIFRSILQSKMASSFMVAIILLEP